MILRDNSRKKFLCILSHNSAMFSSRLHDMHRSGLIKILRDRKFPKERDKVQTEFSCVTVNEVTPVLVVMATGVVAAVLMLTLERLLFCIQRNSIKCH
jgi:hypothetical protein